MNYGLQQRSSSQNYHNINSSRSHSVFQIYLERISEKGGILRSTLRIVDLAGSEKYTIKKELPQGEKQVKVQELTSINSSLSALGLCLSALSDMEQAKKHVPYRNSVLTKVLKDSLTDTSKVAMIICISPSTSNCKETQSTLQFAERARKVVLARRDNSA